MRRTLILVALVPVAGCDSLTDDDYLGESHATLSGTIVNESEGATPPLDVGILWYVRGVDPFEAPTPAMLVDTTPVVPQFPSGFELSLYAPPRVAVGRYPFVGEVREAMGVIALVAPGAGDTEPVIIATDDRFELLYLEGDLSETSEQARTHCGPLAAGYHLVQRSCAGDDCTPLYQGEPCGDWEAPDGLDTLVTLELR